MTPVTTKRALAFCASILAATALTAAPQAAHAAVTSEVIFNEPGVDTKIEDRIVDLINGAESGSTIKVAIYAFTDGASKIAAALKDADRNRNVNVQIVTDEASVPATYESDFEEVRTSINLPGGAANSKTTVCPADSGCIAPKQAGNAGWAIMHNKFMLFSSTGGSTNVLLQTSENFNINGGGTGNWNNAVINAFGDSSAIYPAYSTYFDDLVTGTDNSNYWAKYGELSGTSSTVQFFPKSSGDPIADKINAAKCKYSGGITDIRIAVPEINRTAIIDALKAKKAEGCWIDLVTTTDSGSAVTAAVSSRHNLATLHSKYLLIDGQLGTSISKWVWTGSANMTNGSLRFDDETVIQLKSIGGKDAAALHGLYQCNFYKIRKAADGTAIPGCGG